MERSVVEVAVEGRVIKSTCWRAGARLGRVCSKSFGDRDACFDREHVVISVLVTGILHSSGSIAGPLPLCIRKRIGGVIGDSGEGKLWQTCVSMCEFGGGWGMHCEENDCVAAVLDPSVHLGKSMSR
jgi:hypothetical protein